MDFSKRDNYGWIKTKKLDSIHGNLQQTCPNKILDIIH